MAQTMVGVDERKHRGGGRDRWQHHRRAVTLRLRPSHLVHLRLSGTLRAVIRKHAPRIVLLVLVVAAAIWLFGSGAYRNVDVDAYRERLRAAGAWGAIAFVLLFAFVQPLGPSGHVLVI